MAEFSFFSVDAFKTALNGGGVRANQFFVRLSYPNGIVPVVAEQTALGQNSDFLVSAATLPGSIINPTIVPYRGREVKFAGERVFQPWTITVLNDANFSVRNSMEIWMESMNSTIDARGLLNPRNYQTDLYVTQLNRNNQPLKQYKIVNAFPIDIGDIALSFGDNDTIETFTVTFQYQHFETSPAPEAGAFSL